MWSALRETGDQLEVFQEESDFENFSTSLTSYLTGESDKVPYLKLHGTLSKPGTCLMSARATHSGLAKWKEDALRILFSKASDGDSERPWWIYVGASMRDFDLDGIFRGQQLVEAFRELWVTPLQSPEIDLFLKHRENQSTEARESLKGLVFNGTADQFFTSLAKKLEED